MNPLRAFFQSILEIIVGTLYPFVGPFARMIDRLFPQPTRFSGKTIVIVERWFNRNPLHRWWVGYLQKKGLAVHIVNFPIQKGNFEESSKNLLEYVVSNNLSHVTLVGISAGALTSLLFLQHQNGWKYVDKFMSIAGPFHGTPMAVFISFIYSGRELLPNSTFVKNLTSEKLIHPEKMVCLSAKFDEMVPRSSSTLEGVKTIVLNVVGHNNFHLNSHLTYNLVAEYAKG